MASSLLVFSDDWGRHPSSCQHLIRALPPGTRVTWVNTIGMRPPRLDMITLRRGAEKLRGWFQKNRPSNQQAASNATANKGIQPTIVDAKMWPWMTRHHDRWLNRQCLIPQLRDAAQGATAVTTIPIVADLIGHLPADRWVYYCVDDFSVWPGLDQKTMLKMERKLVDLADHVIAASEVLQERVAGMGRDAEVLTHGVDVDRWSCEAIERYDWPTGVAAPVLLFWGVVDRRLDSVWMTELSTRWPESSIVFVGPNQNPDEKVLALPNVHTIGAVDIEALPGMAHAADCLIMPYIDAAVTRAMQPLKLKEYLATGRPVVARCLPATEPWADCLDLVASPSDFYSAVQHAVKHGVTEQQIAARGRLSRESWGSKAAAFSAMLAGGRSREHSLD